MTTYSTHEIRRLLDRNVSLFCECGACDSDDSRAIAPVRDFLYGEDGLHELRVQEAYLPDNTSSIDELCEGLASAITNEQGSGYLHFKCDNCGERNRMESVTVGRLEDVDWTKAIFISGTTETYLLPRRHSLYWQAPEFVCNDCGHHDNPHEVITEGPDAPEIGWKYAECPECSTRVHPESVDGIEG